MRFLPPLRKKMMTVFVFALRYLPVLNCCAIDVSYRRWNGKLPLFTTGTHYYGGSLDFKIVTEFCTKIRLLTFFPSWTVFREPRPYDGSYSTHTLVVTRVDGVFLLLTNIIPLLVFLFVSREIYENPTPNWSDSISTFPQDLHFYIDDIDQTVSVFGKLLLNFNFSDKPSLFVQ